MNIPSNPDIELVLAIIYYNLTLATDDPELSFHDRLALYRQIRHAYKVYDMLTHIRDRLGKSLIRLPLTELLKQIP